MNDFIIIQELIDDLRICGSVKENIGILARLDEIQEYVDRVESSFVECCCKKRRFET